MARGDINFDSLNDATSAASLSQTSKIQAGADTDKESSTKKLITIPTYWEQIFDENIKGKSYHGTWQAFIRQATAEKLQDEGVDL